MRDCMIKVSWITSWLAAIGFTCAGVTALAMGGNGMLTVMGFMFGFCNAGATVALALCEVS